MRKTLVAIMVCSLLFQPPSKAADQKENVFGWLKRRNQKNDAPKTAPKTLEAKPLPAGPAPMAAGAPLEDPSVLKNLFPKRKEKAVIGKTAKKAAAPENAELTDEEKKLLEKMTQRAGNAVKESREVVRPPKLPFGAAPPSLPRQVPQPPRVPVKTPALGPPSVPQPPPEPPKAFTLTETQTGTPDPIQQKQS